MMPGSATEINHSYLLTGKGVIENILFYFFSGFPEKIYVPVILAE